MDNSNQSNNAGQGQGASEDPEHIAPGQDRILQSNYSDIPSPTRTTRERISVPHSHIQSINEDPDDANPAREQTTEGEQGHHMTTAEYLLAREDAEEARLRAAGAPIYQDADADDAPHGVSQAAGAEAIYPFKQQETAVPDSVDSPDVQMDFEAMDTGVGAMDLRARAESMLDRDDSEAKYNKMLHGNDPHVNTDYIDEEDDGLRNTGMKNIPDQE